MKNLLVYMIVAVPVLTGCDKISAHPTTLPEYTQKDVAYGTHPSQKLDIYLPANRDNRNTKLIILIHGGGWSNGDKVDFTPYVTELKKRLPDFAFASINYRLLNYTINKFPTQENDVKAAVQFLLNKSKEYGISNDIVLLGASAGGHLALLQAYKHKNIVKPKAVVSFFGPTDLVSMYNNPHMRDIPYLMKVATGFTLAENPDIYRQSSPVTFVDSQSSPTLLLQGGTDYLVPSEQANLLKNKLEKYNVPHELISYPNEGHGWFGDNLTDSFNRIEAFIKLHIK